MAQNRETEAFKFKTIIVAREVRAESGGIAWRGNEKIETDHGIQWNSVVPKESVREAAVWVSISI